MEGGEEGRGDDGETKSLKEKQLNRESKKGKVEEKKEE